MQQKVEKYITLSAEFEKVNAEYYTHYLRLAIAHYRLSEYGQAHHFFVLAEAHATNPHQYQAESAIVKAMKFVANKQYNAAIRLLETIDHPHADELSAYAAEQKRATKSPKFCAIPSYDLGIFAQPSSNRPSPEKSVLPGILSKDAVGEFSH